MSPRLSGGGFSSSIRVSVELEYGRLPLVQNDFARVPNIFELANEHARKREEPPKEALTRTDLTDFRTINTAAI